MGKVKGILEENMIKYPELYNGHADEEFWMQCRKEGLLKKKAKKLIKTKRGSNVRRKKDS